MYSGYAIHCQAFSQVIVLYLFNWQIFKASLTKCIGKSSALTLKFYKILTKASNAGN